MKTVLSIDFDIIMSPSINVYNDSVDKDTPVSLLVEQNPCIESGLKANLYQYQYLTHFIVNNCNKIIFISSHDNIIQCLKTNFQEPVNVVNIDHHHDVVYDEEIKLTCGNWVKYGKDHKLINDYTWVKNDNSYELDDEKNKKYINKIYTFRKFSEIQHPHFDLVVICASWDWIPEEYKPLFKTWVSICEAIQEKSIEIDKIQKI